MKEMFLAIAITVSEFFNNFVETTRNALARAAKRSKGRKPIVTTTWYNKQKESLHFTRDHSGKMSGMESLSTSCLDNKYCQNKCKNKSFICFKCFALAMLTGIYKSMQKSLSRNTRILTGGIIPEDLLPIINNLYFRFESFGDLNNEIQFVNYCNIARKNPQTVFALWTKNPFIIRQAIKSGMTEKPDNMIIIYSSPLLNKAVSLKRIQAVYPFVDKVFTVFESEKEIENQGLKCNCGARYCLDCLRCYTKSDNDKMNVITELLK